MKWVVAHEWAHAGSEEHVKRRFVVVRSTCILLGFTILPVDGGYCGRVSNLWAHTFVPNALP